MSVKVLVVLSLVAMASASPAPLGFRLPLPSIKLEGTISIGTCDLGVHLSTLFKTIIGSKHIARKNVPTLMSYKIKNFEDICGFSIKLVISLCDSIEASYKGLGVILSRTIIIIMRIIICILGKGGNNPVCRKDVHALVGVSGEGGTDIQGLIKLYGAGDFQARLNRMIKIYTKGLGISRCKRSPKVVWQISVELVNILQILISGSGNLTKDHLTICFSRIAILIGAIGNSRKSGLGLSIVKNYVPTCNKYMKIAGYKEIVIGETNIKDLDDCNGDSGPWAVSDLDTSVDGGASVSVCGLIGGLFRGLLGIERLLRDLVKWILGFVIRSSNDVFELIIRIIIGLGGVLDATCSGLGSLMVRICVALLKINTCWLGSNKYGMCKPGWDTIVGVSGSVTSIDIMFELYGIKNCRSRVEAYISAYVKIYGVETGSVKILFDTCRILSLLLEGKKWDKKIVITVIKQVTLCMGAVGNSNSKGVGTSICNKFIPTCHKYLADDGYPGLTDEQPVIISSAEGCNNDEHTWCSDIDTSDGKTGWIIDVSVDVSGGGAVTGGGGGGGGGVVVGGIIRDIFGTITGVKRLVGGILDAILRITINSLKDVFNFTIQLVLIIEVILNNVAHGLGTLCVRLVAVILKIAVCVKGCPGDRGICTKAWNQKFKIDGDGSTGVDIIRIFKLSRVKAEYDGYVKKCTKGKGISALPRNSIRIVLEKIYILIKIILNFDKISKDTVTDCFVHLISITVAIGNSKKRDSGKQICRDIVPKCGKCFKQEGYTDITVNITIIESECKPANDDDCDWNGGDNTTPSPGDTNTTPGDITGTIPDTGTTPSGGETTVTTQTRSVTTATPPTGGETSPSTPSGGGGTTPEADTTTPTPATTPKVVTTQRPDTTPKVVTTQRPDTTPEVVTTQRPDSTPEVVTTQRSHTTPKVVTTQRPDTTPEVVTTQRPDTTPEVVTTQRPDTTPEVVTTQRPHTTPKVVTTQRPDTTPEVVTTQRPDTTPEVVTTQRPDTTPKVVTTQRPDTTPKVVTTQRPHTTPKVVTTQRPDTTPKVVTTQRPDTTPKVITTQSPGGGTTPGGDNDDDCGPSIGVIIKEIPGCTKLGTIKLITEIINIRIKTMTDVINLCVKVTICLGGILDLMVTGLGSILTRMVAVIYKTGCCVHGWGDRSICTKEYNAQVGVIGDATEFKDIINLYRLQNCKTIVITIIEKYTGGKDISKQTDVISVILQKILIIVDIITSGNITKQHFTICFVQIISILGCVINSYSKGSGTAIVQKVIPVCGPHLVKQGCPDIREEKTRIVTVVTIGNNARIDWKDIQTRSNSGDLTTDVKVVFKDKGSNPSLQQVFNLETPSSFDGCISFLLKLLHALGTVIDVFCNGLGKLVVRIVGLLIHYIVAILGKGRHSRSFVCQKAYFDSFGIKVKSSAWDDLVTGFNLDHCKQDLDAIVAAQKGKVNIVIKVILDCTSSLVSIMLKGPKIVESDLTDVVSYSFTIFAAFANSCQPDMGRKICERFVPVCSSILENKNYPALTGHQSNIVKKIEVCNNVKVGWVAKTTVTEN